MFSCEFCETFQNTFFYRTPPVAASGSSYIVLTLYEFKPFNLYFTNSSFHRRLFYFLLLLFYLLFLYVKVFFSDLEREVCLYALRMRINIHFGPLCRDDGIICEKQFRRNGIPHLQKLDLRCEKHLA